MSVRFERIIAVIVASSFSGCASQPAQPPATTVRSSPNTTTHQTAQNSATSSAAAIRTRLTNTGNGLELRRWTVLDQPDRLRQALAKHVEGQAVDAGTLARLKRNGLRLARVPLDQLEALLADLGGATIDATEWQGQILEWRSLLDRPIDPGGCAVAVDGQARRYARGVFRLMARSWTVQMEDGPYVHLEMAPRRHVAQADNLRRLLGEESAADQGFGSMALDLQLQAGYAYVLVSESPQTDWPEIDGAETAGPKTPPANGEPARSNTNKGPADMIGPQAMPPPTLGELLLAAPRNPPRRGLLVFVPRIGPELFRPDQAASPAAAAGATGGS